MTAIVINQINEGFSDATNFDKFFNKN